MQLMPSIDRLSTDASEHVRAALASVILGLAPVLQHDATIAALLPLFLRLLKDSSPQVRLNIISKLEAVNAVIGLKVLSQSLLPAIAELSSDRQWRVRHAIIEFMPLLARQLGADFFAAELTNLCVRWLTDSVFAIREAAAVNLRKLTDVFGAAWAASDVLPRIAALERGEGGFASADASPYQLRLTSLQAAVVRESDSDGALFACAVSKQTSVPAKVASSFAHSRPAPSRTRTIQPSTSPATALCRPLPRC